MGGDAWSRCPWGGGSLWLSTGAKVCCLALAAGHWPPPLGGWMEQKKILGPVCGLSSWLLLQEALAKAQRLAGSRKPLVPEREGLVGGSSECERCSDRASRI